MLSCVTPGEDIVKIMFMESEGVENFLERLIVQGMMDSEANTGRVTPGLAWSYALKLPDMLPICALRAAGS